MAPRGAETSPGGWSCTPEPGLLVRGHLFLPAPRPHRAQKPTRARECPTLPRAAARPADAVVRTPRAETPAPLARLLWGPFSWGEVLPAAGTLPSLSSAPSDLRCAAWLALGLWWGPVTGRQRDQPLLEAWDSGGGAPCRTAAQLQARSWTQPSSVLGDTVSKPLGSRFYNTLDRHPQPPGGPCLTALAFSCSQVCPFTNQR